MIAIGNLVRKVSPLSIAAGAPGIKGEKEEAKKGTEMLRGKHL